ncbi:hypothetical protein F6V30_02080 [Oryzomonas sagensis]|uniref:Periplasmic heavy metal sensor n=1 Tax=Oryzomonas sagensis TaxID=2603857 RepID=A0ABQ6TRK5_9BACT|nr:hypothetical protein [Oryzomonas sagensis]KAB0671394.1 hypothetical protein F6V30_02080 [Oryzomonas sagensis]
MKNFKVIAGILVVFLLGAAGGALVTYMVQKAHFEQSIIGNRKIREELIVERLTRELGLDSRQQEQVKAITHETHEGIGALKKQIRPQIEALLTRGQGRVEAVLRPDQRETFRKLVADWETRKNQKERDERNRK